MTEPKKTSAPDSAPAVILTNKAAPRSPFLPPGTAPSTAQSVPFVAKLGVTSTRIVTSSAGKVADRLATSIRSSDAATTTAPKLPPGSGTAGQLVNLVFGFSQVFTYGMFRLLEMLAGPLEQLIEPDTTIHNDAHLALGPVEAGGRVEGTFNLENAGAFDAEVSVVLPNPLASVRGHIAADRIVFTPNPKSVPANGSAEVRVQVNVPTSTAPGNYLGIVRSDEIPGLVLILGVEVA
jgi:hypothetical protein